MQVTLIFESYSCWCNIGGKKQYMPSLNTYPCSTETQNKNIFG
uniref:Uncharacterized protein n=1 Tax=Anguilla anguilla TaxID=7936 RepID=A0A0E9PFY3_ANGAN